MVVSIVSPDWEIATTSVFSLTTGIAVAELVGEFDLDGHAAPVLDRVLGDLAGVGGGAAGDDDDLVDGLEHGLVDVHLIEGELAVDVEAAQQGIRDGLWLVVDLLVHEGGESALFRSGGVPVDLVLNTVDLVAVVVCDDLRNPG